MGKLTVWRAPHRGTAENKQNSGFTLVEALLTVAILVVLLGLSMVAVARWQDPLKITELDNAAREIYMAAENRSVLLQGSGAAAVRLSSSGLTPLSVTLDGAEVKAVILSNDKNQTILTDLLPAGVIDPALWDGHFYILYDKNTHHVLEVFYAEKEFAEGDLDVFRGSQSQRISYYRVDTASRCLVGHYGGGLVDGTDKPLPDPGVEVIIENGNELTLTVRYTIPAELTGIDVNREPAVTLEYGGTEVKLLYVDKSTEIVRSPYNNRLTNDRGITDVTKPMSAEYTWVLDSLAAAFDGSSQRFKDLSSFPSNLGGDFTVTASLKLSADGYFDSSDYVQETENSLFAFNSGGETAYIVNLRHLQNLDTVFSRVAGKKTALQIADIDAGTFMDNKGDIKISNYEFIPIENWDLSRYEARRPNDTAGPYSITNLNVTSASAATLSTGGTPKRNAGLFYGVNNNFEFKYVRLVDSVVEGAMGGHIGGLAGTAPDATFTKCSLENVTVSSPADWSWSYAGGLAGYWWGTITFDGCEAKNLTVESSGAYAGGLAGSGPIAIVKDCIVGDPENVEGDKTVNIHALLYAGGLVGNLEAGGTFSGCEAVSANVTGSGTDSEAGGLVGRSTGAIFEKCAARSVTVAGVGNAGGLMGGTVRVSLNTCTTENVAVTAATGYAGGLVGNSAEKDEFVRCKTANAVVTSTGNGSIASGLVGGATDASLEECIASGITVKGVACAGGLVGQAMDIYLAACTAENVSVTAVICAGGLTGDASNGMFNGCKAVNAKVNATQLTGSEAGGLVGKTMNTNMRGCQVYWSDMSLLSGANDYQITAETSGGLVGAIRNGGIIESSFSATLVRGTIYAGGLVGYLPSPDTSKGENSNVDVSKSYADCYLQVSHNTNYLYVGGLIGAKNPDVKLTLKDVYAAGFINVVGSGEAAGLCGGWVAGANKHELTAENAYAAIHYRSATNGYPLACNVEPDQAKKLYCLESNQAWSMMTYEEMCSIAMGDAFEKKDVGRSRPYNLDGKNRDAYPFPGLVGLPHYGDWRGKTP